jgi:hypothetical protein
VWCEYREDRRQGNGVEKFHKERPFSRQSAPSQGPERIANQIPTFESPPKWNCDAGLRVKTNDN